jgi:hypothetical protein
MNGALRYSLGKLATDDAIKNRSWYQKKIIIIPGGYYLFVPLVPFVANRAR